MILYHRYPPPPPRSGRWGNRDALLAHLAEGHGRDPDFDHPNSVFGPHRLRDEDFGVLRRSHRAMHKLSAGPDHDH